VTNWTPPPTVVRGQMIGENYLNAYVRDNPLHLKEQISASATGFFRGLRMRSHPDEDVRTNKVSLLSADAIGMDDGEVVAGWQNVIADLSLPGAGGLDTGSEQASTWYRLIAVRKSSDGTKGLMFSRAKDYFLDESLDTDDGNTAIRNSTNTRSAASQGFAVDTAGPCEFVDVELNKTGTVTGNIWCEIHSNNAGVPSGTVLATSDKVDASEIGTASQWIRFIFRTPVSLTAATTMHLVITGTWTQSDANTINWRTDSSSPAYANGAVSVNNSGTWTAVSGSDASFKIWITRNDSAVVMPSGYDQQCHIGFAYNNAASNLVPFITKDRRTHSLRESVGASSGTILADSVDLTNVPQILSGAEVFPPGPISVTLYGSLTPTAYLLACGPIPDGWRTFGGNVGYNRAGGRVILGHGSGETVSLNQEFGTINTEFQGVYASNLGGAAINRLGVSSWEW
jgi:hypothetical protein